MIQAHPKPGTKKKRSKTVAEKAYHNLVASHGCIICGAGANIHHVRPNAAPKDHMRVLPLCHRHHQGSEGLHHLGKRVWWEKFGYELDLLEILNERLNQRKSA
ncbi:MAG: hypothetical protein HOC09_35275 [Deltaproteobacteria bacterium]|nr:hypothetical protein [Deltaproteobacteria bacterium]